MGDHQCLSRTCWAGSANQSQMLETGVRRNAKVKGRTFIQKDSTQALACSLLSLPEPQALGELKHYGFQTGKESTAKTLGQSSMPEK